MFLRLRRTLNTDFECVKLSLVLAAAIVSQNSSHYDASDLPIGSQCCMAYRHWFVCMSITIYAYHWFCL